MIRLLLPLLLAVFGPREPDENTVWDDEQEAREAVMDAAEVVEADDAPSVVTDE